MPQSSVLDWLDITHGRQQEELPDCGRTSIQGARRERAPRGTYKNDVASVVWIVSVLSPVAWIRIVPHTYAPQALKTAWRAALPGSKALELWKEILVLLRQNAIQASLSAAAPQFLFFQRTKQKLCCRRDDGGERRLGRESTRVFSQIVTHQLLTLRS